MQRMRKRRRRKAAKTAPIMIPIIAAVESFFDFLWAGEGFCDGDGEGVNGLQGGNGPPQRSKFPAKEEVGNLANDFGIEPLSLLLETLKFVKLTAEILGSEPENPLFCKKIPLK